MGTVIQLTGFIPLWGYFPDRPDGACSQTGIAGAYSDGELCVDNPLSTHTLAHEMGHAYHDLELLDGGIVSGGCTGGATWSELEVEKCVTSEGFADFVATAVWWAPSSPDPYFNGLKTNSGNSSILQCGSSNDQPHRRRGNVSRFFWAPYDSTTTGDDGADDLTWTFSETAGIWTSFSGGHRGSACSRIGQQRSQRRRLHHLSRGAAQREKSKLSGCAGKLRWVWLL